MGFGWITRYEWGRGKRNSGRLETGKCEMRVWLERADIRREGGGFFCFKWIQSLPLVSPIAANEGRRALGRGHGRGRDLRSQTFVFFWVRWSVADAVAGRYQNFD